MNGVNGYVVKGKGVYSSASIFLPCVGYGKGTSLNSAGSVGNYWSSVPDLEYPAYCRACYHAFNSSDYAAYYGDRSVGRSVRPVQSP